MRRFFYDQNFENIVCGNTNVAICKPNIRNGI